MIMGLKAAVQALKKAERLKERVQGSKDLLNDAEAWLCQKQLQGIYQQVLILDLEYALDRKVEQELWNYGFKNYIGALQNLSKDKKNQKRAESQAMLSLCLEAASGFYLTLLQEICTAFDLDLPFRRKGSVYGNGKVWRGSDHFSQPNKSSCYYICQHCLVHLGDIARYRNQSREAEAFYRHAVQLSPQSGQPYNQLALLEASRGDRLSTVFHYVRSVTVRHLFPAAATNLSRTFNKSAEEQLNVDSRSKLSVSEYISLFLKLHGLLHTGTELQQVEKYVRILTTMLTAHVATESLSSWKLVQMLAINLYALQNASGSVPSDRVTVFSAEQLSADERQARSLVLDLLAGSLSTYLLPVYTLKDDDALVEYFALPAVKLTLDWIMQEPQVLGEAAFTSRLQIWPSLCKLLNGLQAVVTDFDPDKYTSVPLPEDRDLQAFIPLEKAFSHLRFNSRDWEISQVTLNNIRASRLLEFGSWLVAQENYRLLSKRIIDGRDVFEPLGGHQVPPTDLIRELEELSLIKLPSPAPSDAGSWGSAATGASTPDNLGPALFGPHSPPLVETPAEKRAGILKPQGSLEKAREKEQGEGVWGQSNGQRKGRQNVAMQAIMRKSLQQGEPEHVPLPDKPNKVTFKTPSPSISPQACPPADETKVSIAWSQQNPSRQSLAPTTAGYLRQRHDVPLPSFPSNFSVPPPPIQFRQPPPPAPVSSLFPPVRQPSFAPATPWRDEQWWAGQQRMPCEDQSAFGRDASGWAARQLGGLDPYGGQAVVFSPHSARLYQQPHSHIDTAHLSVFSGQESEHQSSKPSLQGSSKLLPQEGTFSSLAGDTTSTYSLFSSPSWTIHSYGGSDVTTGMIGVASKNALAIGQQSLWSGPGPSPLERLLEQQKQLREGPAPKGGT
ncbi:nonsense-mediated mRNA decay factor SMG7-like [Bacillus rossius redtenbacheri]|uniref:nonsense-mediated mRNA decay factor SMG7-like n=1 Tax=Bacillus rossius redtenbacheri TaxID=93214 RepID=UPI002FDD4F94